MVSAIERFHCIWLLCFTSYLFVPYDVIRVYTAKHLIVIIQICTILLYLFAEYLFIYCKQCKVSVILSFYSTLWIIDVVIRITQLCYLLHYLTSCSINWGGCFVTNLVVIIQITQLFILEFYLNLKEPMPKAYLFLIVAKVLLQKACINSTFNIIDLLIFVVWIIEIYGSMALAALIDVVGPQWIEVVSVIHII